LVVVVEVVDEVVVDADNNEAAVVDADATDVGTVHSLESLRIRSVSTINEDNVERGVDTTGGGG
jgi:hypothetical protein